MSRYITVQTIKPELWSTLAYQYTAQIYSYSKFIPREFFLVPIVPEDNKITIAVEVVKKRLTAPTAILPPWKKV